MMNVLLADCVVKVCAFINDEKWQNENIRSFASWSREPSVRKKSSSGGTGFEIARMLSRKGYNVVSVCYNADKKRAEHYVARCVERNNTLNGVEIYSELFV